MGGEAAATKSISSPASAACFLTTRTQAHTRTYLLVFGGGAHQPDNKETHRGELTRCSQDSITYHRRPVSGTSALNSFLTSAGN